MRSRFESIRRSTNKAVPAGRQQSGKVLEQCQGSASGKGPGKDVRHDTSACRFIVTAVADNRGVFPPCSIMKRSRIDRSVSGRGSSHTTSLDKIEALSRTHLIQSTKNTSTLERTNTVMNQVSDSINALGTTVSASHQSTIFSLEQLSDKMEHLSGLSTGQSETVNATCNAILELLKQQLPVKSLESAAKAFQHDTISPGGMNHSQEVEPEGKAHIDSGDDHSLQSALDRMRHFAKQKQKTAFSEEADTVIRNLQQILKLLLWAEEEECGEGRKGMTSGETSETDSTHNNLVYQDEVKQIKRMLGVSHCISINAKGQYRTD